MCHWLFQKILFLQCVSFLCVKWYFKWSWRAAKKKKSNTSKAKSTRQLECVWIIGKALQWVKSHLLVLLNNNIWPITSPVSVNASGTNDRNIQTYPSRRSAVVRCGWFSILRKMSCRDWCQIPTLLVRIWFQEIKCRVMNRVRILFWLS